MAKVLVVGGAGYVGSAVCAWLLDRGHDIWVLDDLTTGFRELALGRGFTLARAGDQAAVRELLEREGPFDCAMHFAASAVVVESGGQADRYHENNVVQTRRLLEALVAGGVRNVIYSSTCAVFGDPGPKDIDENLPRRPINVYGSTKVQAEAILAEFAEKRGLRAVALRYFNAAGAEPGLRVGERHAHETHLIPNALEAALDGTPFELFGDQYGTPDGTCIRDYVHVSDLAAAHEAAMGRLLAAGSGAPGKFEAFNLGSEKGFSVKEILLACEKASGRAIRVELKPPREGDPPRLVANSALARRELGFHPAQSDLGRIVQSALDWEKKRRQPVRAVFLDRDGTLNEDPGYLSQPEQMSLFPGVGEALASLKKAGFRLVVVSNQSGVGRGLIRAADIPRIHERLDGLLRPFGVKFDGYALCFHRPEELCECRKPKPKLILDSARALNVDLARSYMVGDKASDLGAGRAAGCGGVALVRTGYGRELEPALKPGETDFTGDSLLEVARWILSRENAAP